MVISKHKIDLMKQDERLDQKIHTIQHHFKSSKVFETPQKRLAPYLSALKINLSKLPPIIHAVGTNGKGSTLHYIKTLLNQQGKTCHRFTSPHLEHYCERIEIADQQITSEKFTLYLEQLLKMENIFELSLFDVLTLIALKTFQENPADYCLIETGLGGRLDSTNLDYPVPVNRVITSISLDHQEYLGSNLDQIIKEKKAVIRTYDNVYISDKIDNRTKYLNLPLIQQENLSLAINVLENLLEKTLSDEAIAQASKTLWRGRYQDITKAFAMKFNLTDLDHHFYIDGAHNIGGIKALVKHFGYDRTTYVIRSNKKKTGWEKLLKHIKPDHLIIVENKLDNFIDIIRKRKKEYFVLCGSIYWGGEILGKIHDSSKSNSKIS